MLVFDDSLLSGNEVMQNILLCEKMHFPLLGIEVTFMPTKAPLHLWVIYFKFFLDLI